jgi:catechol 2,3-dioxygenase-like lactoylglutathione lyase family enzyme
MMQRPHFTLLYVQDPGRSAEFYARLLARQPVEASPSFAMFALGQGAMLGLWAAHTVQPAPAAGGGGAEIAWPVEAGEDVDALHAAWLAQGLAVAQAPAQLDFGYTFVALDPDGHRLRIFAPGVA